MGLKWLGFLNAKLSSCALAFIAFASLTASLEPANAASTPAPVCKASQPELTFPELGSEVNQVYEAIDSCEEPPFAFACRDPDALKDRPKTGLFKRSYPANDSKGRKTSDLIEKILAKIETRVRESRNMASALKACLTEQRGTAQCKEAETWATRDLPEYVAEARFNLALAQSPHELKTWAGQGSLELNSELSALGSYKDVSWQKLTETEQEESGAALRDYVKSITQSAEAKKHSGKAKASFTDDAMVTARYRHYLKYHEMISTLPLMQYLSSPRPDLSEILKANDKLLENIKIEQGVVADSRRLLEETKKTGKPDPELLSVLNYTSLVEETLLENPEYCGLATSLVYTGTNRQIGNAIAVGLPILAVSFFAPPAIGIVAGLGAGGFFALDSQNELGKTRARAFSQLYGDSTGIELDQVRHAELNRDVSVVTLPIGYGLASAAAGKVGVRLGAAAVGLRVTEKASRAAAQTTEVFRRSTRQALNLKK